MAQRKDTKTGTWCYYGSYLRNGKRIQFKKRGFKTKTEAKKAEAEFICKIEEIKDVITFGELSEKYLAFAKGRIKDSSYYKNLYSVNKWNETFKDTPVTKMDKFVMQNYIDELDKQYSKKYVQKLFYCGNVIFKYGLQNDLINFNPLDKVIKNNRPNERKKEMLFWEPSDFNKFIENVDDPMWKAFFATLFYMGIRRGECIALMWKDIDFDKKLMNIDKTSGAKDRTKKIKYTTPKTNNSYRVITMPNILVKYLKEWQDIEKNFSGYGKDSFVFGNDLPLPAENIRRAFDRYIKETNIKLVEKEQIQRIRIHDLRHSHASYLINNMSNGFTDYDIAKRLGDTLETLHNTYAHWFKHKDAKIIDFMNTDLA